MIGQCHCYNNCRNDNDNDDNNNNDLDSHNENKTIDRTTLLFEKGIDTDRHYRFVFMPPPCTSQCTVLQVIN